MCAACARASDLIQLLITFFDNYEYKMNAPSSIRSSCTNEMTNHDKYSLFFITCIAGYYILQLLSIINYNTNIYLFKRLSIQSYLSLSLSVCVRVYKFYP